MEYIYVPFSRGVTTPANHPLSLVHESSDHRRNTHHSARTVGISISIGYSDIHRPMKRANTGNTTLSFQRFSRYPCWLVTPAAAAAAGEFPRNGNEFESAGRLPGGGGGGSIPKYIHIYVCLYIRWTLSPLSRLSLSLSISSRLCASFSFWLFCIHLFDITWCSVTLKSWKFSDWSAKMLPFSLDVVTLRVCWEGGSIKFQLEEKPCEGRRERL